MTSTSSHTRVSLEREHARNDHLAWYIESMLRLFTGPPDLGVTAFDPEPLQRRPGTPKRHRQRAWRASTSARTRKLPNADA